MKIVTLLRKPLAKGSSVAQTALSFGAAGLSIDSCRVGTSKNTPGGIVSHESESAIYGRGLRSGKSFEQSGRQANVGRWPANLIVEHLPGCKITGAVKSSYMINQWDEGAQPFGGGAGKPYTGQAHEGASQVWSCQEGCVASLLNASAEVGGLDSEKEAGVARFFKQVKK